MKKLVAATVAVTSSLFIAAPSLAATAGLSTSQFVDVRVNLTAVCQIQGSPLASNPIVNFGDYTAFQTADVTAPTTTLTVECTRGLTAPTYSFDGATGYGVIAGLNYEVTASAIPNTTGTAATAELNGVGSADTYTLTLGGTMLGGQAGAGVGGATSVTRTLYVNY